MSEQPVMFSNEDARSCGWVHEQRVASFAARLQTQSSSHEAAA